MSDGWTKLAWAAASCGMRGRTSAGVRLLRCLALARSLGRAFVTVLCLLWGLFGCKVLALWQQKQVKHMKHQRNDCNVRIECCA